MLTLQYPKQARSSPAAIVVPVMILSDKSLDLLLGHRGEDAASFWAAVDALRRARRLRGSVGQVGGSEDSDPGGPGRVSALAEGLARDAA